MTSIKVVPIDANLSGDLAAAVDSFIAANFGKVKAADKAWSVYAQDEDAVKVLGFATCNIGARVADVPVYHVLMAHDLKSRWEAMKAHELLFARVTGFIADTCGGGTEALFYIAPNMQDHWAGFQKKVNGRNANRFAMEV
jgi:hypothetical protein